jgi:hypothetical protein
MAKPDTKSIFDGEPNPTDDVRLDAQADAEIEAGQFIPHSKVVTWLQSWSTANKLPRPQPKAR